MATTNQLVSRAKFILSRRNNAPIEADIIAELAAAQSRLEGEKWLPDFLYTVEEFDADAEMMNLETEFPHYLRLHHNAGGIMKLTTATDEPFVKLTRYDDRAMLLREHPGELVAGGECFGYFMVDTLVTLRPRPTASVIQRLQVHFYEGEATAPAAGNSTLWTQKAGDYLLGEAGIVLAQSLRDKEAMSLFQILRDRDKARLLGKSVGDEQADADLHMGGED